MENKEKFLRLVSEEETDTVDRARKRLQEKYEELKVSEPVIGNKYHVKWARSIKYVWRLKHIVGNTCYLSTKNGKIITCDKSELLETRLNIKQNRKL